jgi:hypothetical protein
MHQFYRLSTLSHILGQYCPFLNTLHHTQLTNNSHNTPHWWLRLFTPLFESLPNPILYTLLSWDTRSLPYTHRPSCSLSNLGTILRQCCVDAHILNAGVKHFLFGPKLPLRTHKTPLFRRSFICKLTCPFRRRPISLQTNAMYCSPLVRSSGRLNCIQSNVTQQLDSLVPTDNRIMHSFQHIKINLHQTHIIGRNQSTVTHCAQIKYDNLSLSPGLSQKISLPSWRILFTLFLLDNTVNAFSQCRTLTRYYLHTSLCLLLSNHNSNQINVYKKFVRFTLSASNKTKSAIGPTNQNHRVLHHQPSPNNMENSASLSGTSASSAPTSPAVASRYFLCLCPFQSINSYFRLCALVVFPTSLAFPPFGFNLTNSFSCSWSLLPSRGHCNPFLTHYPIPLSVVDPHAYILGCPCFPIPPTVVDPCVPFGHLPSASFSVDCPPSLASHTYSSYISSLGKPNHHFPPCDIFTPLNILYTWTLAPVPLITLYPLLTHPNQFPLSSTNNMIQENFHLPPSSRGIHTHFSKIIRARKLAHSLSSSCLFILTSCNSGLRLYHQHMQRVLCQCLTFTTTSCSAYCTSVIPPHHLMQHVL